MVSHDRRPLVFIKRWSCFCQERNKPDVNLLCWGVNDERRIEVWVRVSDAGEQCAECYSTEKVTSHSYHHWSGLLHWQVVLFLCRCSLKVKWNLMCWWHQWKPFSWITNSNRGYSCHHVWVDVQQRLWLMIPKYTMRFPVSGEFLFWLYRESCIPGHWRMQWGQSSSFQNIRAEKSV
jgi:hypothetical protein